jgi:hypothetical protein
MRKGKAMLDPNRTIPEGDLDAAYTDLLKALARYERDALRRAAAALEGEPSTSAAEGGNFAAKLARAWLAFTGNQEPATPPDGSQLFTFTYPAHLYFEIVSSGGAAVARRLARRAMGLLLGMDEPLGGVDGPLPAEPSLLNLTVWVGSNGKRPSDRLELELME